MNKKIAIITLIVLIVAVGGFLGYKSYSHKKNTSGAKTAPSVAETDVQASEAKRDKLISQLNSVNINSQKDVDKFSSILNQNKL